jgi:predicted Fe-Mo cluster-binding NifX family protein
VDSFKIAVATKDGKVISEHFGRCACWSIIEVTESGYRFLERRETVAPCAQFEQSDDSLNRAAELLSDCRAVLALKIGPGAAALLESSGILCFEIGAEVDFAVKKLIEYFNRLRKHN